MANFVLVDHSLKAVGGHHYEYAVHVLHAARQAGFDVVLATHKRFRGDGSLHEDWQLRPVFRHDIYCRHAFAWSRRSDRESRGGKNALCPSNFGTRSRWADPRQWFAVGAEITKKFDRRWRLRCFARSYGKLFRDIALTSDDHVFLPTLSEFDLLGLVQFLAKSPETQTARWHLQFHFKIFDGRATEYDSQPERLDTLRKQFRDALALVPGHDFRFYCTTSQMAAQYNRLQVGEFHELPYAINPALGATQRSNLPNGPLRVTCAGGVRREKGREQVAKIVRQLWHPYLDTGQLRFFVQADRRRFRRFWPNRAARWSAVRAPSQTRDASRPAWERISPLVRVPHPLCSEEYLQFVRGAGIGMFLYDGRGYYARFSGVLAEMLAAGVPVIVPAGCWLSEQIAEPIGEHLDQLRRTTPVVASYDAPHFQEGATAKEKQLVIGPGKPSVAATLAVPASTAELLVRFRWLQPETAGTYVRLVAEQYDLEGDRVDRFTSIVGPRQSGRFVSALVPLSSTAATLRLWCTNAYDRGSIVLGDLEACFLEAADAPQRSHPAGAVGLIAAGTDQVAPLLKNIVQHYSHYQQTAAHFSRGWLEDHVPWRTITTLLDQTTGDHVGDTRSQSGLGNVDAGPPTVPREQRPPQMRPGASDARGQSRVA